MRIKAGKVSIRHVIYSLDSPLMAAGRLPVSTSVHQGKLGGVSLTEAGKLGFLFSKKALTPSFWSLRSVSVARNYTPTAGTRHTAQQTYDR